MATVRSLTTRIGFAVNTAQLLQARNSINSLKHTIIGVGAVASGIGVGLAGLLKFAGDAEQARISFTVMLGSAQKANKVLAELGKFAAQTPFTIPEVEKTGRSLLAARVTTEELIPTLKMLGDVAAGVNVPMEQVTKNFVQIKAQGKLTGRELRDFLLAGIPMIQELGKNLGKSDSEISKMVSAGMIGFKDVEHAFQTMSGAGGLFANLMQEQSKSLFGVLSNLKDILIIIGRTLGGVMISDTKTLIVRFREWLVVNQKIIKQNLARVIEKFTGFLKDLIQVAQAIGKVFRVVSMAFGGWLNVLEFVLKALAVLLAYKVAVVLGSIAKAAFLGATGFRALATAIFTAEAAIGAIFIAFALLVEDFIGWQEGKSSVFGRFVLFLKELKAQGGDSLGAFISSEALAGINALIALIQELKEMLRDWNKPTKQRLDDEYNEMQSIIAKGSTASIPEQAFALYNLMFNSLERTIRGMPGGYEPQQTFPVGYPDRPKPAAAGASGGGIMFAPTLNFNGNVNAKDAISETEKLYDKKFGDNLLKSQSTTTELP